jgi:DNA invertase Pin-like site-specific DNA recombinase
MAPRSNAVDHAADVIRSRLSDLNDERVKLERALAQLTGGRAGRRGPGRPRGSTAGTTRRRRGRRNTRADQALKMIRDNPGITASEIAKRMRIKPNYLYRVLGDLQKSGAVKKDGRSYTAS